jgi:hypothetical protein
MQFRLCAKRGVMDWPAEDAVSELLTGRPGGSAWLLTVGILAMGMTPLGLILGGIWGAILTSAFFLFVWLASIVWMFARHGSLGALRVLPSAMMVVAWPALTALFWVFG